MRPHCRVAEAIEWTVQPEKALGLRARRIIKPDRGAIWISSLAVTRVVCPGSVSSFKKAFRTAFGRWSISAQFIGGTVSIRHKLIAGYLSVALFTVAAGLFGFHGTSSMLGFLEGGEKHFRSIVESVTDLNAFAKNASDHILLYLALHDSVDRDAFFTHCKNLEKEIGNLDDKVALPQARQSLERISAAAKRFDLLGTTLIKHHDMAMRSGRRFVPEDHRLMVGTLYEEGASVRREAVALAKLQTDFLNRQEAITAATELSSHTKRASGHMFLYLTLHDKIDKEKFFDRCAALKTHVAILRQREAGGPGEEILAQVEADARELEQVGKALIGLHDSDLTVAGQFVPAGREGLMRKLHELANNNQLAGRTLARLNVDREMSRKADAIESASTVRRNILLVMAAAGLFGWRWMSPNNRQRRTD
jgi:hypothetical protein